MRSLAVSLFLAAACGGAANPKIIVNGIEVYQSQWDAAVQELSARASFDFHCQTPELQFTLFRRSGRWPSEVGVSGCGQQGVYIRPAAGHGLSRTWVLNSATVRQDPASSAPAPALGPLPASAPGAPAPPSRN